MSKGIGPGNTSVHVAGGLLNSRYHERRVLALDVVRFLGESAAAEADASVS